MYYYLLLILFVIVAICTIFKAPSRVVFKHQSPWKMRGILAIGSVLAGGAFYETSNSRVPKNLGGAAGLAGSHRHVASTKRFRPTAAAEPMPSPLIAPRIRPRDDDFSKLPTTEQSSLSSAIHTARHAVWPLDERQAGIPLNIGTTHFAANSGQNLTARFLKGGTVRFESGNPLDTWQATVGLKGATADAPWRSVGPRAERLQGGITEWYVNQEDGFEHGFTIADRPDFKAVDEPYILQLVLHDLRAEPDPGNPGDLVFTDSQTGRAILGYRDLVVWDAEGNQLSATMRGNAEGVIIAVNDQGARYPLTVDPLLVSLDAELGEPPNRFGDLFGLAIDIDGDTAVVGTATADDVGPDGGAAYVFVRNAGVWTIQQKLFKTGINDREFGCAVTISEDTIAVGATRPDLNAETVYNTINFYQRTGGAWTFSQRITPFVNTLGPLGAYFDPLDSRRSPFRLDMKGDRLVTCSSATGCAEFYTRSAGTWTPQTTFFAPEGFAEIRYGYDVALSGTSIAVSAPDINNGAGGTATGKVFVYRSIGNLWTDPEIISASGGVNGDQFGCALAFSGDHLVVGAKLRNFSSVSQDIGAIYPFEWNGSAWTSSPVILSSTPVAGGEFGAAIAISGGTMAVGAPREPGTAASSGTVSIYQWNGTGWIFARKLQATDGTANDLYGYTVAMSGTTLIVGAPNHLESGSGLGSAYLHVLGDGTWPLQQKLVGDLSGHAGTVNFYGSGAALEGDTAVLGSDYIDTPYGMNSGAIYIFTRTAGVWAPSKTLIASDAAANGAMGKTVALSGNTVLAGSPNHPSGIGAVYVFTRSGQDWSQQAKVSAPAYGAGSGFGTCIAIDGETFVTSVPSFNNASGKALVFRRTGSSWGSPIELTSQKFNGSGGVVVDEAAFVPFGLGVAIKGNRIAVGSPFNVVSPSASGTARVYTRNEVNGSWGLNAVLTPTDQGAAADWFGWSLSFSDSDQLAIGAPGGIAGAINGASVGNQKGKVFVFGYGGLAWTREAVLSGTEVSGENFGMSVDMGTGARLAVGAWENSPGLSGKARLYQRSGITWNLQQTFTSPSPQANERFGSTVSLDGNTLLVAAPYRTARSLSNGGTAYIYRITDPSAAVPILMISRSQGSVVLTWSPAPGWSLYQSPSLMAASWSPAGVTTPGTFQFPISSAPKMFFRLQNP